MQTINSQPMLFHAPSVSPACWPECVEESFERLVARLELFAALPVAGTEVVCAAARAL